MTNELKSWQHATASLLILLLFIAVFYSVLIAPALSARSDYHETLDDLQFQYSRIHNSLRTIDNIRMELDQLRLAQPDQQGFFQEKAESLVAADMQQTINELVNTSGGELVSTQLARTSGDSSEAEFPKLTINVHMRATIEALQKLLYQVMINDPVLVLDSLQIHAPTIAGPRGRARQTAAQLDVRFDMSAFVYRSVTTE
jgi:hypothetical protein